MDLFRRRPTLVGVVHLAPLPGAPRSRLSLDAIVERAIADAKALAAGGMDAVLVENYGDFPFFPDRVPPETVAALAVCAREVRREVRVPVGVNCLRNDARAGIGIAVAAGASFLRVNVHVGVAATDQGILEGKAFETLRARRALSSEVAILADVRVKHARPLGEESLAGAARDAAYRGLADALVVTGSATGEPPHPDDLREVRAAVADRPLLVGSGASTRNASGLLPFADGAIVGTSLKRRGVTENPVDGARVRAFVRAARARPARRASH